MASYYGPVTLDREQLAQVAYQAGFRGEALSQMVAIAMRESGGNIAAHRTDSPRERLSGDLGLWQINYTNHQTLINAGIIKQASDLFDAGTNAKAALYLYQQTGLQPWAISGNPMSNTNLGAAQQSVQSAANKGILGADWNTGTTTSAATGTVAATASLGPTALPSDARLVQNSAGVFALFQLAPGVWISYGIPGDGSITITGQVEKLTDDAFHKKYGQPVAGSRSGAESAEELREITTTYGSYGAYATDIMNQLFPVGDPRRNDTEILRIVATRAGRPDMTDAEFENLLKGTQYYQTRTEGQLAWNDLSEAEKGMQRQDMAARMAQAWLQYTGQTISTGDKRIQQSLEDVASGKMGFGQWTEGYLKPRALAIPESPWNRQLRDEKEDQRSRGNEIENTVSQLRGVIDRWGVTFDEKSLLKYATQLVEKTMSDDDFTKIVKAQAKALYPWKDPDVETVVAASPWIDTYNRTMERTGSLQTKEIKQVLLAGKDPWTFEQELKGTKAWTTTKNGQDEMYTAVAQLGQDMGF